MNIKHIDVKELKNMSDREGLIIQGCGGSLEEWVTGVYRLPRTGLRFSVVMAIAAAAAVPPET